jgi:hypothetical protein
VGVLWLEAHTVPQAPQLLGSVVVFAQYAVLPAVQSVCPVPHDSTQLPAEQSAVVAQGFEQTPQLA